MIAFKSEEELVNYLMTSDFTENLSPVELIDLLINFRHFHRKQHSKTISKENEIDNLKKKCVQFENSISILKKELEMIEFKYRRIKTKKLSIKERIKGKILEK